MFFFHTSHLYLALRRAFVLLMLVLVFNNFPALLHFPVDMSVNASSELADMPLVCEPARGSAGPLDAVCCAVL